MTKIVLAALAALLIAPLGAAHGAPEARSIDTRILADDDGWFTFVEPHRGHDLLALDVREAYLGTDPAVWFRLVYQAEADFQQADNIVDHLHITSSEAMTFSIQSTYDSILSHDFDAAYGPFAVQDGHPRALDLVLTYATLGIQQGDELVDIRVESHTGGEAAEYMPGTYETSTGKAPWMGDPTHEPDETPATWKVSGPADLLTLTLQNETLQVEGDIVAELTLTNELSEFEQVVRFSVGDGFTVPAQVYALEPGESRSIALKIEAAAGFEHVALPIHATSDMGGASSVTFHLYKEGAHDHHDEHTDHDGMDHSDGMEHGAHEHNVTIVEEPAADQEAPGAPLMLVVAGLAALAIARRR